MQVFREAFYQTTSRLNFRGFLIYKEYQKLGAFFQIGKKNPFCELILCAIFLPVFLYVKIFRLGQQCYLDLTIFCGGRVTPSGYIQRKSFLGFSSQIMLLEIEGGQGKELKMSPFNKYVSDLSNELQLFSVYQEAVCHFILFQ